MNILEGMRRKDERQSTGNDSQCDAIQTQSSHTNLLSSAGELNIEYVFSDAYFKEFPGELNLDPIERQ
jgi:hypothetical protein